MSASILERVYGFLEALRRGGVRVAQVKKRSASEARADESLLERPFFQIARSDSERMKVLVQRLADRLKTRLLLGERREQRGRLDVRQTHRSSLATGDVPARIHTRRRLRERPKLVVTCDVSDSVRSARVFRLAFLDALFERFRRVRHVVWLCPKAHGTWGDSARPLYARHTDAALTVRNLTELASAMDCLVL